MPHDSFSPDSLEELQGLSRSAIRLLKFQHALANTDPAAQKKFVQSVPHHAKSAPSTASRNTRSLSPDCSKRRRKRKKKSLFNERLMNSSSETTDSRPTETIVNPRLRHCRTDSANTAFSLSRKYLDSKSALLLCVMPCMAKASMAEVATDLAQLHHSFPDTRAANILVQLGQIDATASIAEEASMGLKKFRRLQEPTPVIKVCKQAIGKPRVWAQTRQELCESLPYFRAFQSGIYAHNNVAMGYLLDAFVSPRDYIGERVVISHGGGKACLPGSSSDRGNHELREDQLLSDRGISALINNYTTRQPLVLIMGSKCPIAPAIVPHRYCVLDWFRITHIWTERESDDNMNIRYKFRFEKVTAEAGWWSATRDDSISPDPVEECRSWDVITEQACSSCSHTTPTIYQQHMCLNAQCELFWTVSDENTTSSTLMLNMGFTKSFTQTNISIPFDIKPDINIHNREFYSGNDVSRIFWRGVCCPNCGKLNSRVLWRGWKCSSCDFTKMDDRKVFGIAEVLDPFRPVYSGPPLCFDWKNPLCTYKVDVKEHENMRITRYLLGEDVGQVHHIACGNKHNKSADEMFHEYQVQEIDFRRRAMKTKVDGHFLSAQFSHNAGVRYKYHAQTGTEEFSHCASVINRAKDLITERVALSCGPQIFNEVLSVAYFEGQHMNYHDDGETGVSSVVASLSLGSSATMKFRPKRGKESFFFDEASQSRLSQAALLDDDGRAEPQASTMSGRQPYGRDILRLHLEHGDVMVMQGPNFQKVIEHAVVPNGFRIAATARHIAGPGVKTVQSNVTRICD